MLVPSWKLKKVFLGSVSYSVLLACEAKIEVHATVSGGGEETDSETATISQIRELGNGMQAMQAQLSSVPTDTLRELLNRLQQHIEDGRDVVLPTSADVSPTRLVCY